MSTRDSALFRLARGRSLAPREPRSPSPPPSSPRAAREQPEAVASPPNVASPPKPKPVASSPQATPLRSETTPLRVVSWDQDTQSVFVRVAIPRGTPASRVRVASEVRSLHVRVVPEKTKAKWYGVSQDGTLKITDEDATLEGAPDASTTVDEKGTLKRDATNVGGALSLPCVAGDTVWTIDRWSSKDEGDDKHDCVCVVLTKASRYLSSPAWSKLFADDAEEKSLTQLARELADADEPSPRHCDLPEAAQIALEDTRERRLMMGAGRWTPDDPAVDDFRVVLSNRDEDYDDSLGE